jgi:hypothetical protein
MASLASRTVKDCDEAVGEGGVVGRGVGAGVEVGAGLEVGADAGGGVDAGGGMDAGVEVGFGVSTGRIAWRGGAGLGGDGRAAAGGVPVCGEATPASGVLLGTGFAVHTVSGDGGAAVAGNGAGDVGEYGRPVLRLVDGLRRSVTSTTPPSRATTRAATAARRMPGPLGRDRAGRRWGRG